MNKTEQRAADMKCDYHPNPAINQGFHYQQELERHLSSLIRNPTSDHLRDALLESLMAFREALQAGTAVVPGERIVRRRRPADMRRCA